ncbi:hypothetical protein ACFO9Q_09985 [Paenibacillus sp. GCM10023252]|uniref:hypothetical protein n=1 Tax=Paenibacillus sp. GCM10023252 TaxID=3252649 RepID=UPI0036229C4A
MTIKYRTPCFGSELIVKEIGEEEKLFQVCIQSATNPLGTGNKLGIYNDLDYAITQLNRFCKMYTLAREGGYHLSGDRLTKHDKPDILVSSVLDDDVTEDQLRSLLEVQISS